MLRTFSRVVVLLSVAAVASAQTAATYDPESRVFRLDGGDTSYVFGVNSRGELQQLYWGGREGKARTGTPKAASGAWWMNHGLEMGEGFRGDFQAAAFRLDRR